MKYIKLTRGQVALVDDEDFDYLNRWKWYAIPTRRGGYYAQRMEYFKGGIRKIVCMHSFILDLKSKELVADHVDSNGLNNQKTNLRICTKIENSFNRQKQISKSTSKYKGVYWYNGRNKWRAQIMHNGKNNSLGYYKNEEDAAKAYNKEAKMCFGEFAKLNILQ